MTPLVITHATLSELLALLAGDGYTLVGPRVRDGVRAFDTIEGLQDLPRGLSEVQAPGRYALSNAVAADSLFAFCATEQSLKRYFIPPSRRLFSVRRSATGPSLMPAADPVGALAVIGARGCDLAGLRVLDGVLGTTTAYPDAHYARQRQQLFTIAVHCTTASETSFCGAMGTGPAVSEPFDLALTEIVEAGTTNFLLEVGSDAGEQLVTRLSTPAPAASLEQVSVARTRIEDTEAKMRQLPPRDSRTPCAPRDLQPALQRVLEAPHWEDVASRCLACGNCTMICPTCFCTTTSEQSAFAPDASSEAPTSALEFTSVQTWQSCFSLDHSYLHGGHVRDSVAARYRQWLVHKLSTWWDQFGSSGCVGCGRCTTWCPVGIDILREAGDVLSSAAEERVRATPAIDGEET